MASTIQRTTKSGQIFYEIQVSRGRGRSKLTKRWYPPDGWSKRAIDRELNKVAADFERQVNDGEVISRTEQQELDLQQKREAAKILTLREYGETVFMPAKTVTISENSRCSFQSNLDNHIYPALGDLKMPDITPANISALLLSIQSQGRAHATVIKVYTVLNTLFKMAYLNDAIEKNPMDKVQRPKPRKGEVQGEVEAYTVEEVRRILDGLEKEPLKWRVFLRLLIDTGIRRGECCALQWKDINFKAGTVTICGNLCYTPHKGVYLDTPKSGKSRTIDVDPDVLRLLRQHQSEQAAVCISQWVFTQEGKPDVMNPQTPTRYFKRFSQRYGIEDFHPHKLRHPNVKPKTKTFSSFLEIFGSITKVVGCVSLIGFTAGIKEFKEEVVIVGISVSLASKGLDFVIDSLNFAGRDFECGMGNDTLEMAVQKSAEPE